MNNLKEMCDTAAWLDKGHLRLVGDADAVVEAYERSQNTGV
jgi:ABC-type polysaccharide/polyol phosphate transport system ATPase subunit